MAEFWVKSGGAWSANPGGAGNNPVTAGTSYATIAAALTAGATGGDIMRVSDSHSETTSVSTTFDSGAIDRNNPLVMLACADGTGNALTATAANAQWISTTNNDVLTLQNCWYLWAVNFTVQGAFQIGGTDERQVIADNCKFTCNQNDRWINVSQREASCILRNCTLVDFGLYIGGQAGRLEAHGCTWSAGAVNAPNYLIQHYQIGGYCEIRGGDFGAYDGTHLVNHLPGNENCHTQIIGTRLPNIPAVNTLLDSSIVEIWGDDANDYFSFYKEDSLGTTEEDAGVYRSAQYDGTNGYSAKIVAKADAAEFYLPHRFKVGELFNDSASSKVFTGYLVRTDSTILLQDDEFWFEVQYPNSTNLAQRDMVSTRAASPDTTPANLTDDDAGTAWTGRGATYKQMSKATVSVNMGVGPVTVWACLAKPSQTVYVEVPQDGDLA